MKSFTSLEQSKKLAEILPIESADFHFSANQSPKGYLEKPIYGNSEYADYSAFPCWSLAALLSVLDFPSLTQNKEDEWEICVPDCESDGYIEVPADNPVDACYEMIIKLDEQYIL